MGQVTIEGEVAGEGEVVAIYVEDEFPCKHAVSVNTGVAWLPNALVSVKGGYIKILSKLGKYKRTALGQVLS
jgi:hypothetical protein